MENKEMVLKSLGKTYSDDYTCELTQVMDKYLFRPINERLVTYLYDPEYYLRQNEEGKYVECFLGEVFNLKNTASIPIRFPGATRGHVTVDSNKVIIDIVLYEETCFGKNSLLDPQYTKNVIKEIKKFIGRKIVIEKQ